MEGGSHEGLCPLIAGKRSKALGNETSPSTLRFVKDQKAAGDGKNIALEVEDDAGRFACELLCENVGKPQSKGRRHQGRVELGLWIGQSCGRCMASWSALSSTN